MNPTPEHKVSFGGVGRTIIYEDPKGRITFGFDVSSSRGPNGKFTIYLEGSIGEQKPPEARMVVATERTKEYLVSSGYDVVIEV